MGVLAYDEDPVTSPLCAEPCLPLGTIEEAREGSTGDESEIDTLPDPTLPVPCYSVLKKDKNIELNLGEEEEGGGGRRGGGGGEEEEAWRTHPDIDAGWAYVIMISSFCLFVISSGMLSTNGMYYAQMLQEYKHSRSYTAWIGSLLNAFYMLGGPISAVFIKHYGCRPAIIFGSGVMCFGYFISAFTTSLEALFFTYGVIVACGMNFAYSGQIIALAHYFDRKHSMATSVAMIGIGVGMLLLGPWVEYNIQEYGWRGSFIWNAGISLNMAVFGSLIFPLARPDPRAEDFDQEREGQPQSSVTPRDIATSRSRYLFEKNLNDRSFSSLRLSLGAGYLSHSLMSLSERPGSHHHDPSLRSNMHSFCSRGSHFAIGSIRSNGPSLCGRGSHAELNPSDQPHHPHRYHHNPLNTDPGLTSNTHSFSSRRGSQLGMTSLRSNPHSFCPASQIDFPFSLHPDREVESLKSGGRPRFLLREGECDLGCCAEEDDDPFSIGYGESRSMCQMVVERVKLFAFSCRSGFESMRAEDQHPLLDIRFWLVNFAIFFSMLSTLCIFIIYKDFANSKGLGEFYSTALSSLGIGDVCGRLSMGLLLSVWALDSVLVYTLAMLFCALDILLHIFIASSTQFISTAFLFGLMYGSQNILIAVMPSQVFGKDKLPTVFGHILFLGGVGALIGAPLAGFIVDQTGSYNGLMLFSMITLFFGTCLMFACYVVNRRRRRREEQEEEQEEEEEEEERKRRKGEVDV